MSSVPTVHTAYIQADGVNVFYRYANPAGVKDDGSADSVAALKDAPTFVLLHGFPASSFMFRNLLPLLAARGYRVLALDLPAFGFTEVPADRGYAYTFAGLAKTFGAWVDALRLNDDGRTFAAYVFDYGAPTLFRFALDRPRAVRAVVAQNGNAYVEGLGAEFWAPIRAYWATSGGPSVVGAEGGGGGGGGAPDFWRQRDALRPALELPTTKWQYTSGARNDGRDVDPAAYHLDQALMDRGSNKELQLDLFYDYQTNLALYPKIQQWLRSSGVPVLALWGKHDQIFVAAGAEAYSKDVRNLDIHYLEGGHFALETNEAEAAAAIDGFFQKHGVFKN